MLSFISDAIILVTAFLLAFGIFFLCAIGAAYIVFGIEDIYNKIWFKVYAKRKAKTANR